MAYDPKNPPILLANGIGGARGVRHFAYTSTTDDVSQALAAGYFSNAADLGMRKGDALRFVDKDLNSHRLQVGDIAESGAGTVNFPGTAPEAYPIEADPTGPVYLVGYVGGEQVRLLPGDVPGIGTRVSVKDFGAAGDGVTDDSAALAAATSYAVSLGGGNVLIPNGLILAIGTTFVLPSKVFLQFEGGAKLKWIGSNNGTIFKTADTTVTLNAGVRGILWIDYGTTFTGTAVLINSAWGLHFDRFVFEGTSASATLLDLYAGSSAGEQPYSNRNIAACYFGPVAAPGTCGTALKMRGQTSGYGGNPQVVTLNTFCAIVAHDCRVKGIDFVDWTDNNQFDGFTRLAIVGNNTVGVDFNSADPTTNKGVYSNHFDALAVDAFGTYSGRIGVKLGWSKNNSADQFYQYPLAEGGSFVPSTYAKGYLFDYHNDALGRIETLQRAHVLAGDSYESFPTAFSLADDTAVSIDLPLVGGLALGAIICVSGSTQNGTGIAYVKPRSTGAESLKLAGGSFWVAVTGALAGTTGTDARFTVSAHTDGKIYFENRLGGAITFRVALLAVF